MSDDYLIDANDNHRCIRCNHLWPSISREGDTLIDGIYTEYYDVNCEDCGAEYYISASESIGGPIYMDEPGIKFDSMAQWYCPYCLSKELTVSAFKYHDPDWDADGDDGYYWYSWGICDGCKRSFKLRYTSNYNGWIETDEDGKPLKKRKLKF